ncbi:MAG: flippase-like domain-containing protein [Erysipelotrichaceae bacterium]|nr:flippase-like domain-containing protein [Erysipelotrichaceae bacterium]
MRKKREYISYIALIIVSAIIVLYCSFKDYKEDIIEVLKQITPGYLAICILAILLYHYIVGYILRQFALFYKPDYTRKAGYKNALIAALFHGITPFASGGQFIQCYVFYQQGIGISESASILLMDFIVYQSTLVVYTLVCIVLRYSTFYNVNTSIFTIALLGFIINSSIIVGLWALARSYKLHTWLSTKGIYILAKLKLVKDPNSKIERLNTYLEKFNIEVARLSTKKSLLLKSVLSNIVRLTLYYIMPYLCAKALQIDIFANSLFDIIALSSFVSLANSFVPLPGASGGAEVSFTLMFADMMVHQDVIASMLLWRFLTYYFVLFIGGVVFARFVKEKSLRKIEEELYEDRVIQ